MTRHSSIHHIRKSVVLLSVIAVAGCGWAEWPPPKSKTSYKSNASSSQPTRHQNINRSSPVRSSRTPVRAPLRGGGEVQVARRDTVYAISRRYGVSMRAIIEANRLRPPFSLRVGQRLIIPAVREHRVRSGETLNAIAHTYGLSVYELAHRNRIQAPYRVKSGQILIITQAIAPQRARPTTRTVSSARGPAVKAASLPQRELPPPVKPSPKVAKTQYQSKALPQKTRTASKAPKASSPVRLARTSPKQIYRNSKGFMWPLRGRLISGFGPKAKGLHNDGINIAAPKGAPIRAAKAGVVAYAGNELRGFGNLLLIKHANGWVTAYAHTDKMLVKRGDKVSKGQIIARVGKTGAVTRPQLHFEMRRGKRPVNPKRYLRVASR